MKEEIIDDSYEWSSLKRPSTSEDEQSLLIAKRIKQEFEEKDAEQCSYSSPFTKFRHVESDRLDDDFLRPHMSVRRESISGPPIIFDHFICMRIGLNSENNVQKLMALLAANNFVDLTVIQGSPTTPVLPLLPINHSKTDQHTRLDGPSTSGLKFGKNTIEIGEEPRSQMKKRYGTRRAVNESSALLPSVLKCMKCGEVMGSGMTFNTVLSHVQKAHLKMAAFQCRICKHYRTTQERIQSHVTTVHKARSSKFDPSLAGPISAKDMQLMEKMISICFPEVKIKLEITDRLSVQTFQYNGMSS